MLNFDDQRRQTQVLFALWREWVIACGAPMVVMLVSVWVPAIWLPLVTFALTALLIFIIKASKQAEIVSGNVTIYVMYRVMLYSGIVMLALAFLVKHELLEQWFGEYNRVHSYIPELVIAPITYLMAQYVLIRRSHLSFYKDLEARMGQKVDQGFLGRLFRQEGLFQQKVLTYTFLALTIEGYLYYWFVYYNGYYSPTDKLAFVWLPIIVYVGTVIYMGLRYFMMWMYYGQDRQGGDVDHSGVTRLRYIIVSDEKIYLAKNEEPEFGAFGRVRYDTPAIYSFQRREGIMPPEAKSYFERLTKIEDFTMRFMYESHTVGGANNVIHFIVGINDPDELSESSLKGEWYSLAQVNDFLHQHLLSPKFSSELSRLYHITMAWKTYNRDGYRRYREKYYRPAFRLRDIHNPDVDYNDKQWLYVSRMNEDIPFFRLRRWWDRVINGVDYTSDNTTANE